MEKTDRFSFPRLLKLILDIVFIIGIIWMFILLIAFVITMIAPGSRANLFTTSTLYELPFQGLEYHYQLDSSDPQSKPEMKLFGLVFMKTGNRWFLFLTIAGYFIWVGLYFVIIIQLRSFLKTISAGNPFSLENARRIKVVGWSIIISFLLKTMDEMGAVFYMYRVFSINEQHMFPPFSLIWEYLRIDLVLIGLAVLAISGIFRLGAQLKEDQELTI